MIIFACNQFLSFCWHFCLLYSFLLITLKLCLKLNYTMGNCIQFNKLCHVCFKKKKRPSALITFHIIYWSLSVYIQRRIQKHVAEQKVRQKEVDDFIRDCRLTEERVSADVQALKGFFQKYGYRPSQNNQDTASKTWLQVWLVLKMFHPQNLPSLSLIFLKALHVRSLVLGIKWLMKRLNPRQQEKKVQAWTRRAVALRRLPQALHRLSLMLCIHRSSLTSVCPRWCWRERWLGPSGALKSHPCQKSALLKPPSSHPSHRPSP